MSAQDPRPVHRRLEPDRVGQHLDAQRAAIACGVERTRELGEWEGSVAGRHTRVAPRVDEIAAHVRATVVHVNEHDLVAPERPKG